MKQFTWDISSQFPWNPFPPGQWKMLRIFNVWVRRYFLGCIIISNIGGWPNLKGILQYVRYPGNCWSIIYQLYQLVSPTIFFAPFLVVRFLARGNRSNMAFPAPICDAGVMLSISFHGTFREDSQRKASILRPFHHPKWQQQMLNKKPSRPSLAAPVLEASFFRLAWQHLWGGWDGESGTHTWRLSPRYNPWRYVPYNICPPVIGTSYENSPHVGTLCISIAISCKDKNSKASGCRLVIRGWRPARPRPKRESSRVVSSPFKCI